MKALVGAFRWLWNFNLLERSFQALAQGKDYKKGGDGLRGKNVTEAYRVKDKDLKRTMK